MYIKYNPAKGYHTGMPSSIPQFSWQFAENLKYFVNNSFLKNLCIYVDSLGKTMVNTLILVMFSLMYDTISGQVYHKQENVQRSLLLLICDLVFASYIVQILWAPL